MQTLIPVSKVYPDPKQPRTIFREDSLAELAESIRENGVIQPVTVEDNGDGTYLLVDGERRWRATKLAGLQLIPVNIRQRSNHNGREKFIVSLVANVQREDMNPMDEAEAYQRLHDEYGMKWHEIGNKVGKHPTAIQARALLTRIDPEIQALIRAGKFTPLPEVCRAVMAIPDRSMRIELAKTSQGMTGKQVVSAANRLAEIASAPKLKPGGVPAMQIAQKKSRVDFDDDTPPSGWNALQQAGKVPPWKTVAETTKAVCKACSLSSMASDVTCRECPIVDFITRVVQI